VPGPRPRGFDGRAIGVWLGLLVLAGFVVLAWQARSRAIASAPPGPWLELPAGGMDVSDWASRQWLRDGLGDGLAAQCGHDHGLPRERYTARVPSDDGRTWRAVIDIGADTAWVTASRDPGVRLAPQAPKTQAQDLARGPGAGGANLALPHALPKAQLDALRRSWRSPALWAAPVSESEDASLAPVVLEACVDGRYAVRLRRDSPAARELGSALGKLVDSPATSP